MQGTKDTVNDLLTKYPTFTRKVVLNDYVTAQSKERLYVLVITNKQFTPPNNEEKSKMFVVSSIHANELPPAETSLRFAEYLLEDRKNPDIKWILDCKFKVHVSSFFYSCVKLINFFMICARH